MTKLLLCRVLLLVSFFLLPFGLAAFQSPAKLHTEDMFKKSERLTTETSRFKGTDLETFDMESSRAAEIILHAFKHAYPAKISDYGYSEKAQDWFIIANGKKFLWARGRILPENQAHEADDWRHYIDYLYPKEISDPKNFTQELIDEIKKTSDSSYRASQKTYNLDFYDALYDGKTRGELETHIVSTRFLGKKVNLHEDIVEPLAMVEQMIREEARSNPEIQEFVDKISSVEGYNWREIRDRQDRSFHSWGLAIDIMPKGWQQKNIYWSWLSEWNPDWMLIPLDRRWMPPMAVVEIFEKYGFVWGGKWLQWDNIHFEYRPELLVLQSSH
ncbi:MAG: M15 family metallopeptidase [Spirochaetaceae bacterium]|nr:M15 family metallopeptidase [Spirochaetaceae bacterium]